MNQCHCGFPGRIGAGANAASSEPAIVAEHSSREAATLRTVELGPPGIWCKMGLPVLSLGAPPDSDGASAALR